MQLPHTTSKALRWQIFWIASMGALGLVDLWRNGKRDGSTLSETIRPVAKRHPLLFAASCQAFWRHIAK